jgi:nicotinamidase-related amidase
MNTGAPFPPSGTLLLCIDMQPAFLAVMTDGPAVQKRCAFALEAARGLGLPVLFTEQVPKKLGPTAPELLALVPQPEVFAKDAFSALGDVAVLARIHELEAEHLLLCGLEAPVCVYQTAVAALREGLEVTLLADAVAARRPADAAAVLQSLREAGCHVLPAETVFYALIHNARHPFFRDFTALVKKYG